MPKLNEKEYQCAVCKEVFDFVRDETWSQEEAEQELKDTFGDIPLKECEIVCDNCWQVIKPDQPIW